MGFLFLSLHSSNFGCSHIPCYYFRLLPRPIPSSGIGTAYASLPLPDRSGRKLVVSGGGEKCGALPADCAPARSVVRWKYVVGNDPCVVPHRLSVTLPRMDSIPQNVIRSVSFSNQTSVALCLHSVCLGEKVCGSPEGAFLKSPLWRIPLGRMTIFAARG